PADESDFAINDQKLAMIAMVNPRQVVPDERIVAPDLDSRLTHQGQGGGIQSSGTNPVQEDVDVDAGLGALCQRVGKSLANIARPIDISLEVDGHFGAADRLEHGGENLVAIHQAGNPIAPEERRPQELPQGAEELRITHAVLRFDLVLDAS